MTFIILAIIGIVAVLVVRSTWADRVQVGFILIILLLGIHLYVIVDLVFIQNGNVIEKGPTLDNISWLEISLYFMTLIGMGAKYFFDAIGKDNKIKFKKWQFFKPILVSPIVFASVYMKTGEESPIILLLIFAFQNGFFWQTVLNRE